MTVFETAFYVGMANQVPDLERNVRKWKTATVIATLGQIALVVLAIP